MNMKYNRNEYRSRLGLKWPQIMCKTRNTGELTFEVPEIRRECLNSFCKRAMLINGIIKLCFHFWEQKILVKRNAD